MTLNLDFLKSAANGLAKRPHSSIERALDDYFKTLLLEREPNKPIGGVMYVETDHTRLNDFHYEMCTVVFEEKIAAKKEYDIITFEEFCLQWKAVLSSIDGEDVSEEVVQAFVARLTEHYGVPTFLYNATLGGAVMVFDHFVVFLERKGGQVNDAKISTL